jgi:hypothetical protein
VGLRSALPGVFLDGIIYLAIHFAPRYVSRHSAQVAPMTPISTSTGIPPSPVAPILGGVEPGKTVYFVESPEVTAKILAFTKELFEAEVEVSREFDPEGAEEPDVVFRVTARGNFEELLNKEGTWVRSLREFAPGWNTYCLCVYPIG